MQSFASILELCFFIALIITVVFGVMWIRSRKDKDGEKYKKNKKRTIISLIVMVALFIGGSMAQNAADEEAARIQYAKDKKSYKNDKDYFKGHFLLTETDVESLSKDEGQEWEDAIDNSDGDDFDVDATIEDIEDNHSDDIDTIDNEMDKLHDADQKIQNNTAAPKKDKEAIHNAYIDLKHFANHSTNVSGSCNSFIEEHNDMVRNMSDRFEELADL